jgi:hypothetical protein
MCKIGFYNEKVDNPENLNECDMVFSDYEGLKEHINAGDTVVLSSQFSLFGVDFNEILRLERDYNVVFVLANNLFNTQSSNAFGVHMIFSTNDFIFKERDKILKLISE